VPDAAAVVTAEVEAAAAEVGARCAGVAAWGASAQGAGQAELAALGAGVEALGAWAQGVGQAEQAARDAGAWVEARSALVDYLDGCSAEDWLGYAAARCFVVRLRGRVAARSWGASALERAVAGPAASRDAVAVVERADWPSQRARGGGCFDRR